MAPALFLDTAGWFAALSPRERGHASAKAEYADAARGGVLLVTTPLVIAEMHTLVLRWRGPRAGTFFLETVFETGGHHVTELDSETIEAAIARWIRRFGDKSISLADAVSFEVMRRERITRALTFDRHFVDAGYEMVG